MPAARWVANGKSSRYFIALMDRALLVAACFFFLFSFAYTMYALGARSFRPSRFNFVAILGGFLCQTTFLIQRGQILGRCPLTNLFEVLIFLSWSIVLLYMIVGPAYRLSLLGAFTSPLVLVLQLVALFSPWDTETLSFPGESNFWLEFHAAMSVIAYGAFAIACVAGVMYLSQERQLKTHHLHTIFFHLPPIADLATVIRRLILIGFGLLTAGLLAGFLVGLSLDAVKITAAIAVWLGYALILYAGHWHKLSAHRLAQLSVLSFAVTLGTLWTINFITETPR
jgi:HemX protein